MMSCFTLESSVGIVLHRLLRCCTLYTKGRKISQLVKGTQSLTTSPRSPARLGLVIVAKHARPDLSTVVVEILIVANGFTSSD